MIDYNIAIIFLRVGIAFLFLYAAYMNSKDKGSIQWTIENTKPLFKNTKYANDLTKIKVVAYFGIGIMYLGGLSVLFGIESRVGAFLLILFTIGGSVIHNIQKNEARELAFKNAKDKEFASIAWSAYAAHFSNILKNICLIFILSFICLNGVGEYQVIDLISK